MAASSSLRLRARSSAGSGLQHPTRRSPGYCGPANSAGFRSSDSDNCNAPLSTNERTRGARNAPTQPGVAPEVLDAHLRGQAPVPDRHHPFEPEVPTQFEHLVRNGMGVGGVARIGPDRVDHVGPPAFAVAVAAEAHQRAGAALVTAPAHVGEHWPAFPQVAPGEPAFNAPLVREQPVHRPVQGVPVGIAQVEFPGQCRGMPQPGRGELRGRMHQAFHDHRHDPVALGRRQWTLPPSKSQSIERAIPRPRPSLPRSTQSGSRRTGLQT